MKKFLLPLILAATVTVNTESCDPETMEIAAEGLEEMAAVLENGNTYEYPNCTLVIRDKANLISDSEESSIVTALDKYCNQVECDILLMTTDEAGLSSVSPGASYAQMYLPADSENWICLTYDQKRESYHIYYDGETAKRACGGTQTDAILNAGSSHFRHEEYGKGLQAMAEVCLKRLTKK